MSNDWSRREFLGSAAGLVSSMALTPTISGGNDDESGSFTERQIMRRRELWRLLGDLPWKHRPGPPQIVRKEEHDGYTLERLVLDLNGVEKVPASLLIPHKRQPKAPGLLYIHWHGGMYDLGKEQLLKGVDAQPAYAPVCAEKGLVTLAIDSGALGNGSTPPMAARASRMRSS